MYSRCIYIYINILVNKYIYNIYYNICLYVISSWNSLTSMMGDSHEPSDKTIQRISENKKLFKHCVEFHDTGFNMQRKWLDCPIIDGQAFQGRLWERKRFRSTSCWARFLRSVPPLRENSPCDQVSGLVHQMTIAVMVHRQKVKVPFSPTFFSHQKSSLDLPRRLGPFGESGTRDNRDNHPGEFSYFLFNFFQTELL